MPALRFGRRGRDAVPTDVVASVRDDARIFALTFVGGFLFMSVYLA